jgi:hypothetical protein
MPNVSNNNCTDVAMYGWDLRRNYNMLLSMGGAYRNMENACRLSNKNTGLLKKFA